jgi:integrase
VADQPKTSGKPRRGYGQGSLVEISPGVWRMRIHLGKDAITGKMIQPNRRFHGSRAAAERELARFRAEVEESGPRPLAMSSRVTLNEVVERHLVASEQLAPGTRRTYQSQYERHIALGLGRSPVAKLTAQGMRTYYRRLAEESELSDSSIWSIYSLISGAIRRAQREDGLRFDRNQLVTPRKAHRPEKKLIADDELNRVFDAAHELGGDWPLLFRILCATGMRRGEAMALRWSSLDANTVLTVRFGAVDDQGGIIEKLPKTGNRRELLLDDTTAAMWRERLADVDAEMRADDLEFHTDLYVFSNDVTRSTPRRPDLVSKKWNVIRERADVPADVELRSLRNWHITVLREAGFPLEFIGRRVGHEGRNVSPLAMTASYTVSRLAQERAMAEVIEARLGSISTGSKSGRFSTGDHPPASP